MHLSAKQWLLCSVFALASAPGFAADDIVNLYSSRHYPSDQAEETVMHLSAKQWLLDA